ncbi:MAG: transaldolase family protein [Chthonomonadales bacterium]
MRIASVQAEIDATLREAARNAITQGTGKQFPSHPALARLRELGTELWLDTGLLEEAQPLWHQEFTALTTNNTLANQVVQTGVMDDLVRQAARRLNSLGTNLPEAERIMELGFIVNCHIALRLVAAMGARVSVELHPSVAEDLDRTVFFAQRYYAVCPERFIVKIPLTPEGICAVARASAQSIPINFTLGFSARQNYVAARIANPAFVNVFLGRLNNVVADNGLGDGRNVGERATLASQAAVAQLRSEGKCASRQIAASMREASQVATLAGVDVHTMPVKVAKGFLDAGPDPARLTSNVGADLPVHLNPDAAAKVAVLWEVDDRVRALADDLARHTPTKLTGADIRQADEDHGTHLFHRFTSEEAEVIRRHGKIPDLGRWNAQPQIALDDLMTQSALQSFAVDQAALDARLKALANASDGS